MLSETFEVCHTGVPAFARQVIRMTMRPSRQMCTLVIGRQQMMHHTTARRNWEYLILEDNKESGEG